MVAGRPERMPRLAVDLVVLNILVRCMEAAGPQKETHDIWSVSGVEKNRRR